MRGLPRGVRLPCRAQGVPVPWEVRQVGSWTVSQLESSSPLGLGLCPRKAGKLSKESSGPADHVVPGEQDEGRLSVALEDQWLNRGSGIWETPALPQFQGRQSRVCEICKLIGIQWLQMLHPCAPPPPPPPHTQNREKRWVRRTLYFCAYVAME